MLRFIHFTIFMTWIQLLFACGQAPIVERQAYQPSSADARIDQNTLNALTDERLYESLDTHLTDIKHGALDNADDLWALSHGINDFKDKGVELLQNWAQARGSLPQILTPRIRKEIANNSLLQRISRMPNFLKSILKFFVKDEEIIAEIQAKITALIDKIVNRSTRLHNKLNFRFDHFLSKKSTYNLTGQKSYASFKLHDQVVRWLAVFSINNYWEDHEPLAYEDHGLQVFETLRSLSELQYILGLEKDTKGQVVGGLTYDLNATDTRLGAFDLRDDPNAKRFLSGSFHISYPNGDIVDMASQLEESWSGQLHEVNLDEQAKLWIMGAKIFERLRPANRSHVESLYRDAVPEEVHGISLTLLSSMSELLDGPFIDQEARLLRQAAKLPAFMDGFKDQPASLLAAARTAHALQLWLEQLKKQDDLLTDSSLPLDQLQAAPESLTEALRFVLQYCLRNFLQERKLEDTLKQLSTAETAEVLYIFESIEHRTMQSQHLKNLMQKVRQHLLTQRIPETLYSNSADHKTVLWLVRYLKSLAEHGDPISQTMQYIELLTFIDDTIRA